MPPVLKNILRIKEADLEDMFSISLYGMFCGFVRFMESALKKCGSFPVLMPLLFSRISVCHDWEEEPTTVTLVLLQNRTRRFEGKETGAVLLYSTPSTVHAYGCLL